MSSGQNWEVDQIFNNTARGMAHQPTQNFSRSIYRQQNANTSTGRTLSSRDDKGNHQTSRFLVDNATSTHPRHADDRAPDATAAEDPRTNLRKLLDFASELKNVDLDLGLQEYKMMMEGKDPQKLTDEELYAKCRAGITTPTSHLSGETQSTIDRLRTERDKYKEDVDKLREELETEKQNYTGFNNEKLKKLEREKMILKEELAQERGKRNELKENMKKAYEEMQAKQMEVEQLYKDETDKLKEMLKSKTEELKQKEKEKAEALNRLSKEMGNKLNNKNPNIADLSDSNRPTKIAEKYNELYDNEWTDAMEILTIKNMQEEIVIRYLLEILQTCYQFCQVLTREQMNNLYKQLSEPYSTQIPFTTSQIGNIPPDIERLLIECRKTKGGISVDCLYNEYMKQTTRHIYAHYVQEYVKKCLEVCWLMLLHDPPVVLSEACRVGDTFDTALYKAYTKSGDKVSFTVWLPLLLHAKGPLLSKGVVQPFATESSSSDRRAKSASGRSTRQRDDSRTNAYGTNEHITGNRNTYHGASQDSSGERRLAWTEHEPVQHVQTWSTTSSYPAKDHHGVEKHEKYNQGAEYDKRTNSANINNPHSQKPMTATYGAPSRTTSHYSTYIQPHIVLVNGQKYVVYNGNMYTLQDWESWGAVNSSTA